MFTTLHIVAFDVPYPPHYGGVIDVFFKIKALFQAGVKIYLHCFLHYKKQPCLILEQYCTRIHYYQRKKRYVSLPIMRPHIVESRRSEKLLNNLLQDDLPILFEGLHTCYYLAHPQLAHRLKLVRMHNIEWEYYQHLSKTEEKWWKKAYFTLEAWQLRRFEEILIHTQHVLAISPADQYYLQQKFIHAKNKITYLPAFHANEQIVGQLGKGNYALYHGNLSVNENHEAAIFLVNQVFDEKQNILPLIVAGKNPKPSLQAAILNNPNVSLKIYPSDAELNDLIRDAHIHVLPTFQATGIKLKLLHVLFKGRFCLVNNLMVTNTGLEQLCVVAQTAEDFKNSLKHLARQSFEQKEVLARKQVLGRLFDNQRNALLLLKLIR